MKWVLLIILLCISFDVQAQRIYTASFVNQADVKVYVVPFAHQADLMVYRVQYPHQTENNTGKWCRVRNRNQADIRIYFVSFAHQADLLIHFVNFPHQAGWNNVNKKHLMY